MTDPCWIAAQLLGHCTQASQETPKIKPLPESTEVEIQTRSQLQPQRSIAWPTHQFPWPRSTQSPKDKPTDSSGARSSEDTESLPRRIAGRLRHSLPAVVEQSNPWNYANSLPLWGEDSASAQPQSNTRQNLLSPTSRPRAETTLAAAPSLAVPRPRSGSQLFQQRWAALRAGQLYTRTPPSSFISQWQNASTQPTYEQWQALLAQEARAIQAGQGQNRLTVVVGDSLSMWLPPDTLPRDRFWLNQGISGDTTAGILQRLHLFASTQPTTIHLMAGVNDLKNGASDAQIVSNLKTIMKRLKQQHPQARIVVHSILPTRWPQLASDRIQRINQYVAYLAQQQGIDFLDLQTTFADTQGHLRSELTSDGLHLNSRGYRLWQLAIQQI